MPNELPDVSVTLPPEQPAAPAPPAPPITEGMFSAAQLQAPLDRLAPGPVKYTPTPDELASAVPASTAPVKYTPTADELASAAPVAPNIFEALTPEQMVAEAKANPKTFDPLSAFQALPPDKQRDLYEKAAETFHQLRDSGHYVPGVMDMLKNAGKSVVDLAKTGATMWDIASGALVGDINEPADTFRGALARQTKQQQGEFLAGQKVAMLGLGQMVAKGSDWVARHLHITKPLKDYTPEDKLAALGAELATRHGMERIVKEGISPEVAADLAKQGFGLRPEKVEEAASGSPFAWEGAGKVFGGVTGVAGLGARLGARVLPDAVNAALAKIPQAASDLSSAAVGRTVQGLGKAGEKSLTFVEPAITPVTKAATVVSAGLLGHHITPWTIPFAIAEGLKRGEGLGEAVTAGAQKTAVGLEKLSEMGKQIATGKDITSSTAQLGRDLTQAAPGVVAQVGAGTALDVAAQTTTSETPGEKAGFTPFGTIFGSAGALKGAGKRVVSGQILGPRYWGANGAPARPVSFAQNFPSLDIIHNESMANAPQGVQQRFNAIQKYVDGAAPGTQVVYAPRPEKGQADPLPQALHEANMELTIADQDGAFEMVDGPDGKKHPVVVVRDLEAAPHESRHALDDVIGASGVRDLNAEAKRVYADKWNAFKQSYADRLTPTGFPTTDPDGTILRETGRGNAEAKEKITRETRAALGPDATEAQVVQKSGEAISDLQAQAKAEGKDLWEHILTPTEQADAVDQYVGSEVRAEHHDAWFKAGRPGEARGKMAMMAANVLQALGINPAEGRNTAYGTPLEGALVTQAQKSAPKVVIEPTKPAKEGTPEAQAEGVRNAQKAAEQASNTPVTGANKSPREILGVVQEAIARGQGIKLDGLFAPEEPAASLTSNREVRRKMIEIYRTMPDAAKKLWGKLFFPQNVPVTARSGQLQIFGWAPEVFAANAHKTAEALNALADKGTNLSPYELDPMSKSFTEQGWKDLYDDVQKYVQNQKAGRTGSGEPLVVPQSVTAAGAATPPVRGTAEPLAQDRADFINALFNAKLPDTGLARQGDINMPLNKAGQLISAATMPGRVEVPTRPRENFRGAVAVRQGVKGEPIMEVNPFRNRMEAALQQAGIEIPSLLEVNQRLNLKSIKNAELAPEQGKFSANTLTLQAGFQPPKKGQKRGVHDLLDAMDRTNPEEWLKYTRDHDGEYGKGMTALSMEAGAGAKSLDEVAALQSAIGKYSELMRAALKEKDFTTATSYAAKAQAAREAHEAATGTGGIPEFIRDRLPDKEYTPPFPTEQELQSHQVQFSPNGNPRAIKAAAVLDRETGKIFEGPMHFYVHQKMIEDGYKPETVFSHPQGFVTNEGEFLGRKQAFKRAKEFDQLRADSATVKRAEQKRDAEELVSERADIAKPTAEEMKGGDRFLKNLLAKKEVQAQPRKREDWELKPGTGGTFTKAWVDPEGTLHQFGSQWHHDWLNEQSKLRSKYGIPKGDDTVVRNAALKKGFLRVNYDKKNGKLVVEARSKDWPDHIEAVRKLVDSNADKFDSMEVHLMSNDMKALDQTGRVSFLDVPAEDRATKIPLTGGAEEGAAQVGMAGEAGSQQVFQKALGEQVHKTMYDAMESLGEGYERFQPDNPDFWNVFQNTKTGALKIMERADEGGWKINPLSKAEARKIGGGSVQFAPPKARAHPKLAEFENPDKISEALTKPGWAVLTGTQEKNGSWDSPENKAANGLLESRLTQLGYKYRPIKGVYKGVDQGPNFLVEAISPDAAKDLGNEFKQESVLTPHGLVYSDGSVTPVDHAKNVVGDEAMKQDGWSQLEGGPAFSMGLDFGRKIEPKDSPVIVSHPENSSLTAFTKPVKYSKKALEEMTKEALGEAYPEAEIAGHGDRIDKPISPGIKDSPLYKQAGTEEKAVQLFKKRMVDFARKWQKNPIFQDGSRWYSEIVPLIKQHYGNLADMFAELLAATSPQNDPANNFTLANDALNLYKRGEFGFNIKKYEEALSKIDDGTWEDWYAKELEAGNVKDKHGNVIERGTVSKTNKAGVTTEKPKPLTEAGFMGHWIAKHDIIPKKSNGKLYGMHSIPVLQVLARQWLRNTTGLKTQNFIQNLIGAAHEATVDIWAGRTMRRLGYSGHTDRWRLIPSNTAGVTDPDFLFSQKVFRAAADELGMEPDALQGALWFAEKHLWADNGWSRLDLGDYRKEIPKRPELDREIELNLAARKGGELPPMTITKRP